jgi:hypothetical protein
VRLFGPAADSTIGRFDFTATEDSCAPATDGGVAGDPAAVDFEDWERVAQAREVYLLWPDGTTADVANESQLDDYVMFMPTGNPLVQVMYSNMAVPGQVPFIGMAVLVNP